jgi:hypothetical protein
VKLICKETIEQGLKAKLGGSFKLVAVGGKPTEYALAKSKAGEIYDILPPGAKAPSKVKATSDHGFVLKAADGNTRLISSEIIQKWVALGVAEVGE